MQTEKFPLKTNRGLSANILKIVAIISMFIDHFTVVFIRPFYFNPKLIGDSFLSGYSASELAFIYETGRSIGRLAFPLFCFFIAEGMFYTRDRRKYLIRLGIFALISEIPFRIALFGNIFAHDSNVIFTLFLGAIAIYLSDMVLGRAVALNKKGDRVLFENSEKAFKAPYFLRLLIVFLICLGAIYLGYYFNTDYAATGVVVVLLNYTFMYEFSFSEKYSMRVRRLMGFSLGVLVLTLFSSYLERYAFFDLMLIFFYNGERGKQHKYFFYIFYPAHLILLWLVFKLTVAI